MLKSPRQRIKDLPLNRIAPNLVTLFALSSGVTSIRFAMEGRFEAAVFAIIMAAIFDALDGRVARMLQGTSDFGAELDSLSDVVCFGVAPGLLMYFWSLGATSPVGWIFALLVPICCALRLARFNIMLDDEPLPHYWKHFFVGLPAPGGALVAITPIMLYFYFQADFLRSSFVVELFLFLSAFLMASRLPTISLKKFRVPVRYVVIVLALAGCFAGALVYEPWLTVGVIGILYLLSVPLCSYVFLRLKAKADGSRPEAAESRDESAS
ncbi:MAG: CDP-diacylglycerol--serine O-phosphatidyltransferase [Alphaproteobacteria bacterium]